MATTKKASAKKATTKKATSAKTAAKKTTTKKAAAKVATKKTTAKKAATSKATKKSAAKKTTTKKAPAKKKVTTKTTSKKATSKKTVTTKSPSKSATKTKTKTTAKKPVAKKAAAAKKETTKKTTKTTNDKTGKTSQKATVKSTRKTVSKTKAEKTVTLSAEQVVEEQTAAEAPAKPATKKATKKKTTRKKAKAPREKVVVVGKVGQAPRRTADEVAASNPFPVPPKLHDDIEEAPSTPSAEAKEAKKEFKVNDKIVYPAHGVGIIEAIEAQEIVGTKIEVFVIQFEHEKLRLRVPTEKAKAVGMRELSDPNFVEKTIKVLQGRARIKRTMWSRRAQEYEGKINSGDLNAVAEVVRDLYRAPEQPEQSYSERQLFEAALDRMAREVAAVKKIDLSTAINELDASLQKKEIAA